MEAIKRYRDSFFAKGTIPYVGGRCFLGVFLRAPPDEYLKISKKKPPRAFKTYFGIDRRTKASVEQFVPAENPEHSRADSDFDALRLRVRS